MLISESTFYGLSLFFIYFTKEIHCYSFFIDQSKFDDEIFRNDFFINGMVIDKKFHVILDSAHVRNEIFVNGFSETINRFDNMTSFIFRSHNNKSHLKKRRKIYTRWSNWSSCTRYCQTQRERRCRKIRFCGNKVIRQTAYCYEDGSECEKWINSQLINGWENDIIVSTSLTDAINTKQHHHLAGAEHFFKPITSLLDKKFSENNCGINEKPNGFNENWKMMRIVGGKPSNSQKWKWQVLLLNRFKESYCGGTLISAEWLITAAHCIRKPMYVRLGEYNLNVQDENEVEIRVRNFIIHPFYDPENIDNDIALVKIPINSYDKQKISLACLPKQWQLLPFNNHCTILGWGKTSINDKSGTQVLHEAQVPIASNYNCKRTYENYKITENMFCAGYKNGKKDSCLGDSGGPLLCQSWEGKWTLFGITSFGEGCGKKGKYGIYAKVSNYVDWINKIIHNID